MFLSYLVYSVTLATSVVAYRISSLHPLSKHPGPLMCKMTKLWSVWVALKGDTHLYHKRLHDKYGPTVRIGMFFYSDIFWVWISLFQGPNELSTVDKDLIPFVLGSQGMPKGQRKRLNSNLLFSTSWPLISNSMGWKTLCSSEERKWVRQPDWCTRSSNTRSTPESMEQGIRPQLDARLRGNPCPPRCPIGGPFSTCL